MWNLRIRMPRPISMPPSKMPSHTSVCCARFSRGVRNCGTALAIASTPVSAEHPDANAFRISSTPTASVAPASWWLMATAGLERNRPITMIATMAAMNATVGTVNTLADSVTPHKFSPVISASTPRHSQVDASYRDGNGAVIASMPADTPTAAFST
jgi:hypothetical protein